MKYIVFIFSVFFIMTSCQVAAKNSLPHDSGETDFVAKTEESRDMVVQEGGEKYYVNEKFGFKVKILQNFDEIIYLEDDIGMLMRRDSNAEIHEKQQKTMDYYTVEIGINVSENVLQYPDLVSYVKEKYPEYSIEFSEPGVFVDERDMDAAIRHYFLMSLDKKYIYEAYLKIPAFHYNIHKCGLDEFAKSIELF